MDFLNLIWLIPLFPAAGFVINGLFGKRMSKTIVGFIACAAVFVSFVIAAGAVFQLLQLDPEHRSHTVKLYEWINAGAVRTTGGPLARFSIDWAYLLDPLSSVMVLVVTGIGFLIHVYSTGYMHDEDGFYRFFAYLNLFMFSMLTLVLGSNYLMMFIGWEGVGLCSYLLIGYYFLKKSAGDDAMEGPTPVSALIHAATMVTAGAYMVARSNWLFQMAPEVMSLVAVVGALTALFAASIGLVQNDIKRVLAYSTVSQLGYMFLALGVGAFAAGVFHLMTHAFFKALLFLGSGSVIHAMHHEQDMRKMG